MSSPTTHPGDSVATESRPPQETPCPFCGRPVPPQRVRRGPAKVYCSDRCRSRAYDAAHPRVAQRVIDWNPAATPHPLEAESQRALKRELGRRDTRKRAVLARLQQGPALRSEMMAIGGDRFSARIGNLRDEGYRVVGPRESPRHGIFETTKPAPNGEDVYVLKGEESRG